MSLQISMTPDELRAALDRGMERESEIRLREAIYQRPPLHTSMTLEQLERIAQEAADRQTRDLVAEVERLREELKLAKLAHLQTAQSAAVTCKWAARWKAIAKRLMGRRRMAEAA